MLSLTTPPFVRNLADRYKDLFVSYGDLCSFFCYFLFGCNSLSDLARINPRSRSVSSLSRSIKAFPANRFMRRLRRSILHKYDGKIQPENFVWALDDTANPKYGKHVFRASHWHGSSGPWRGQKIMVLALVDISRGIALPICYAVAAKKDDPEYRKGHDIAIDLLKEALSEGMPKLPVITDSWFDSIELMEKIESMGLTFVGELKSSRKVKKNPGRYVPWNSLADSFYGEQRERVYTRLDSKKIKSRAKRAKVAAQLRLWIRGRRSVLNCIAVYNRCNGRNAFGYYASSDLTMSGARIWEISRARWKIEVMFRDLKQHLSFRQMPCGSEQAADLAICLPMLILISFRLQNHSISDKNKSPTLGDMIDEIREHALQRSIDFIIYRENQGIIDLLKARRNPRRLNQKPVNKPAEAA